MRTVQAVVERVRAEFTEMPGLHLTQEQVQRLCGIEKTMCTLVLDALVKESFLCRKSDGAYARLSDGVSGPRRFAADIEPYFRTPKAS